MHNVYFKCRDMTYCLLGLRVTSFPLEKQRGQIGQCFYGLHGSCGSTEAVSLGAEVSFPLTNCGLEG